MLKRRIVGGLFEKLWVEYLDRVSYADRYRALVEERGGRVANDHIAFRSLNLDLPMQPAGLVALRDLFVALGYEQGDSYVFEQTHLRAIHLEHPDGDLPKLFVSQLEVGQLPDAVAELVRADAARRAEGFVYPAETITRVQRGEVGEGEFDAVVAELAAVFGRPWCPPRRSTVLAVNEVSQYAAWTLLHGNAVNHFTAFINRHAVAEWPDIEATVAGLEAAGVPMKASIEGERGSKLRQSATKAASGEFAVTEDDGNVGRIPWTYAYYELAERGTVVGDDGVEREFSGFLGPQTPGLFEMTRMK